MSEVRFTAEPTGEAVSADALRRLAGELGLELGVRMGGGEIGAWTAMDFAGREVVVKVAPEDQALRFSRAVEVASVLSHRGVGIPGPCQWGSAAGLAYILQPKLRGVAPAPLHLSHARRICEWWLLFAEAMGKGCSWISPRDGKSGSPAAEAGPFGRYARTMLTDGYGLDQAHGNLQIAAQKVTLDGSTLAARAAEELLGEIASVGSTPCTGTSTMATCWWRVTSWWPSSTGTRRGLATHATTWSCWTSGRQCTVAARSLTPQQTT